MSMGGRQIIFAIQFLSMIVLSRLLTPAEIGTYALGMVIANIANLIKDAGVGVYIQQERHLDKAKIGSAVSISFLFSWTLAATVYGLSGTLSTLVGTADAAPVAKVVALNFIIAPFACFAPALLKRDMRFGAILQIQLAQAVFGTTCAIVLAIGGHGFMSMAWASVIGTAASVVVAQFLLPEKYRTGPRVSGALKIFRFSIYVIGSTLLEEVEVSVVNALIGRARNTTTVGLIDRSRSYANICLTLLQRGTVPVVSAAFSSKHRHSESLQKSLVIAFSHLTVVAWPSLGLLALLSPILIPALFGESWADASMYASIICVTGCFTIIIWLGRATLEATGNVRLDFRLRLLHTAIFLTTVASCVPSGVNTALLAGMCVKSVESIVLIVTICNINTTSLQSIALAGAKSFSITCGTLASPAYLLANYRDSPSTSAYELIVVALAGTLSWVLMLYVTRHPLLLAGRRMLR